MTRFYFDQSGSRIELGKRLGTGGEGAVFEIHQSNDYVAKIYHKPPNKEKADKLAIMGGLLRPEIQQFAAWPKTTLHQVTKGPPMGIVIPRIPSSAHEIHELYSPSRRAYTFPDANWKFLIRTALNCTAAIDTLHRNGVVIGDINQGNVFVMRDATVRLIDCDSFQLKSNGQVFKCKVGVAHFTPPELQSAKFDEVVRTPNHDNFGLAILIFHLLFMGRHPYAGRYRGHGDLPIEKAIEKYYFAYSTAKPSSHMAPPPHSLSLSDISSEISRLFERAFGHSSSNPNARPLPSEWGSALVKLESQIRKCQADEAHCHVEGRPCPWCRITKSGGPEFFIAVSVRATASSCQGFNLQTVWAQIECISTPAYQITSLPINPRTLSPTPIDPEDDEHALIRRLVGIISITAILLSPLALIIPLLAAYTIPLAIVFFIWWFILWRIQPMNRIRLDRQNVLDKKTRERDTLLGNARRIIEDQTRVFQSKYDLLRSIGRDYEQLDQQRTAELQQLQASAKDWQLQEYLKHSFISSAKISGIGAVLKSQLMSYGIETAWDIQVERLEQVPGFGFSRIQELLAWREVRERQFRFNPAKGAPSASIQAVETKYWYKRSHMQKSLLAGPKELHDLTDSGKSKLRRLNEQLAILERAVAQARSNLHACG